MIDRNPKAPKHLQPKTRKWWEAIVAGFVFEEHSIRILTLAAEAWDRGVQAREAIAEHGTVYSDRFGCPRTRPEVAIERDSRLAFARLIRELRLDEEQADEPRIPRMGRGKV
jgi:phage terminase small subunit